MHHSTHPAATPRLIMLPGMGTRAPLLDPQRRAFPSLQVPDWVRCRPDDSLADYARRLLDTVDTTGRFYLGGVSFGGMVALEMARHATPEAVLLIGSARSGRQVPPAFRLTARIGQRLPLLALALLPRPLIRLHFRWRERLTAEHQAILAKATRGFDRDLLRWTGGGIARWRFEHDIHAPIYQIHGSDDWLLRPPPPAPGVELIPRGRHMINLTHAEAVNDFIRRHAPDLPIERATPSSVSGQ